MSDFYPAQYGSHANLLGINMPDMKPSVAYPQSAPAYPDTSAWYFKTPFDGRSITSQTLAETTSQQLKTGPQPELIQLITLSLEDQKTWQFVLSPVEVTGMERVYQTLQAHDYVFDPTSENVAPRSVSYEVSNKGFYLSMFRLGHEFNVDFQMQKENLAKEYDIVSRIIVNGAIKRAKLTIMAGINNARMSIFEYYNKWAPAFGSLSDAWNEEITWIFKIHKSEAAIYQTINDAKDIGRLSKPEPVKFDMMVAGSGLAFYVALMNPYERDASKRGEKQVNDNLDKGRDAVIARIDSFDVFEHEPIEAKNMTPEERTLFEHTMVVADFYLLDRSTVDTSLPTYEATQMLSFKFANLDLDSYDTMTPNIAFRACGKWDSTGNSFSQELNSLLMNIRTICNSTGITLTDGMPIDPMIYSVSRTFRSASDTFEKTSGYAKIAVWGDQDERYWSFDQLAAHANYTAKEVSARIPETTIADIEEGCTIMRNLYNADISVENLSAWAAAIALNPENSENLGVAAFLTGNSSGFVQPPYTGIVAGTRVLYVKVKGVNLYLVKTDATGRYSLVADPAVLGGARLVEWPSDSLLPGFGVPAGLFTLAKMATTDDRGWSRELIDGAKRAIAALEQLEVQLSNFYFKGEVINLCVNESMLPAYQDSKTMDPKTRRLIILYNVYCNIFQPPVFVRRPAGAGAEANVAFVTHGDDDIDSYKLIMAGMNRDRNYDPEGPIVRVFAGLMKHPFSTRNTSALDAITKEATARELFDLFRERGIGAAMKRSGEFTGPIQDEFEFFFKTYVVPTYNANRNHGASLFWTIVDLTDKQRHGANLGRGAGKFGLAQLNDAKTHLVVDSAEKVNEATRAMSGIDLSTANEWVVSRLVFSPAVWAKMYEGMKSGNVGRGAGPLGPSAAPWIRAPFRPANPVSLSVPLLGQLLENDYLTRAAGDQLKLFETTRDKFGLDSSDKSERYHMGLRDLICIDTPTAAKKNPIRGAADDGSYLSSATDFTHKAYNAKVMKLLPEIESTVVHSSTGETKNILLDRSPWLKKRLQEIDEGIKEPLRRMCAILMCFTKANRHSLDNWTRLKTVPPFLCYMFIRPFIRFRTTPVLFAKRGKETCILGHNYTNHGFETDVSTQKALLNVEIWMGHMVVREQNFFMRPHYMCKEYAGGMGAKVFCNKSDFPEPQLTKPPTCDGFIFDCGSNFSLTYVLREQHPLRMYGAVSPHILVYRVGNKQDITRPQIPFPSYFFQCIKWGWHLIRSGNTFDWSAQRKWKQSKRTPELAGHGKMLLWSPLTGLFSAVVRGRSFMQNFDPPFKPALIQHQELLKEYFGTDLETI